jgi:hypothetical protein
MWLNSNEHALLTKELLDLALNTGEIPTTYDQVVVAIDPAVSTNPNSDNTRNCCMPERKTISFIL